MKINNKKQDHNIGTHAEKMVKRKLLRQSRTATVSTAVLAPVPGSYRTIKVWNIKSIKTGKYIPEVEDRKHYS